MKRSFIIMLVAAFCCTAAFAADAPRKIDFTTVLEDQDSVPFQECADQYDKDCKIKRPMTLGSAALRSLGMVEPNLDLVESQKRGQLAISIYKSTAAQLTSEEISLIKKQIAKGFNPLVVVRAFAILDPATEK